MAVRIRLKKMGRKARPFFRLCAVDSRAPRDGKVIEELGTYDPMVPNTDARAILRRERIDYWLGVGAQPSEKVAVLIKKYGTGGSHLEQHEKAVAEIKHRRRPRTYVPPAAAGEAVAAPAEPVAAAEPAAEPAAAAESTEASGS